MAGARMTCEELHWLVVMCTCMCIEKSMNFLDCPQTLNSESHYLSPAFFRLPHLLFLNYLALLSLLLPSPVHILSIHRRHIIALCINSSRARCEEAAAVLPSSMLRQPFINLSTHPHFCINSLTRPVRRDRSHSTPPPPIPTHLVEARRHHHLRNTTSRRMKLSASPSLPTFSDTARAS
jgi:hypothetical protein